jgi:hypothetical protein
MRVSQIETVATPGFVQLQARVESDLDPEAEDGFPPFTLWYRFPPWCAPWVENGNGDPCLAALLFAAMRAGERLAIAAPVSPRLLAAVPEIQAIYAAFDPRAVRVPIEAPTRSAPIVTEGGGAGGLFFSLGVDSWYSLLKNERGHRDDRSAITHLIPIHGFDVAHDGWAETFPPALLATFQRVARERGKTLLPVATNLRRELHRLAPWTMLHGGALVSVALALGGFLRRVAIAASASYAVLAPWGTHPLLDPLWSTETLTVLHDGCERDTIDKTRVIAEDPLVLETLRVCPGFAPDGNCGRCMKCLRTTIDLMQAGRIDACRTLPHTLDLDRLRDVLPLSGGPVHDAAFRRRLAIAKATGVPPGLDEVLEDAFATREADLRPVRRGMVERLRRAVGSR